MASREAIGIIETRALKSLEQSVAEISEALSIPAPEYERPTRDRDYNNAVRLRSIATWLEGVSAVLVPQPDESDLLREEFAGMGKDEVIGLAGQAGLAVTSRTTKSEAVEYLVATHVGGGKREEG